MAKPNPEINEVRSSGGSRGPSFPKSQNGTRVSVSPGKGGVSVPLARCCPSTRAASNVRAGAMAARSTY